MWFHILFVATLNPAASYVKVLVVSGNVPMILRNHGPAVQAGLGKTVWASWSTCVLRV